MALKQKFNPISGNFDFIGTPASEESFILVDGTINPNATAIIEGLPFDSSDAGFIAQGYKVLYDTNSDAVLNINNYGTNNFEFLTYQIGNDGAYLYMGNDNLFLGYIYGGVLNDSIYTIYDSPALGVKRVSNIATDSTNHNVLDGTNYSYVEGVVDANGDYYYTYLYFDKVTSTSYFESYVGDGVDYNQMTLLKDSFQVQKDIMITNVGQGVVVKSPNGTNWRITVDNAGAIVTTAI